MLVLSGVTSALELLAATPKQRPTYVAADVRGLLVAHPEVEITQAAARCGVWRAAVAEGGDVLRIGTTQVGDVEPDADSDLDALRALCAVMWEGERSSDDVRIEGDSDSAATVLDRLGLA
jgi:hypothetical protein